jgi:hypothetical protein
MSKQATIFFHIGLMKTGTTYLQHSFFPFLETKTIKSLKDLKIKDDERITFLVSNEGIGGSLYHSSDKGGMFTSFKNSLENISTLFSNPKIIVCFREPSSFLLSSYKQYLHEGGFLPFDEFFSLEDKQSLANKNDLFFSKYLDEIHKWFNEKDVFTYDYDTFRTNRNQVLRNILSFFESKFDIKNLSETKKSSNPSVPLLYESILRTLNSFDNWLFVKASIRLRLNILGKTINPRVFAQYILPRIYRPKKERNIENIKNYYEADWELVKKKIKL